MPYTHDLIVLGAGSGGLATAFRAARHGASVALLGPGALGGTCVNVGCVPKKAMWFAAQMAEAQQMAREYGFALKPGSLDWPTFVARRQHYIDGIHASYREQIKKAGIDFLPVSGRIVAAQTVEANGHRLHAPHIVLATGSRPRQLDIPGFDLGIDSDGFFALRARPSRVAIVGGGYISVELGSVLHALGAEVDILARSRLLHGFDAEMTSALGELMREKGIGVHCQYDVTALHRKHDGLHVACKQTIDDKSYDLVLWAVGRVANSEHLGLDTVGVACHDDGHIQTDDFQNTTVPGIYAVGDVTSRPALTPVAIAAGRRLADRLFGNQPDAHLDGAIVPSVVFAHPPLAGVGFDETTALERYGDSVRCYRSRFTPMQLALSDAPHKALMKLVCAGDDERVIGAHILGPGADEMIQGFAVALKMGARKVDFDTTVAVHPTAAEEMVTMT
ncbi:MAG TPA: glutathione-disulfide reductase [Rhodanobacteraceae bacterium]|nr:glutathione-disulfide reductase [Rhodanobacteraceae bacterium]